MLTREAEVLAKEYGELTQTKEAEASAPMPCQTDADQRSRGFATACMDRCFDADPRARRTSPEQKSWSSGANHDRKGSDEHNHREGSKASHEGHSSAAVLTTVPLSLLPEEGSTLWGPHLQIAPPLVLLERAPLVVSYARPNWS
jgi:hypothetical protein